MSILFHCKSRFYCSQNKLFQFHKEPSGFDSLVGLDPNVKVLQKPTSILQGEKAILQIQIFPGINVLWESLHTNYQEGEFFEDTQVRGPFRKFIHKHIFYADGENSILEDKIELDFPFLFLSKFIILAKLKKQFKERHILTGKILQVNQEFIS